MSPLYRCDPDDSVAKAKEVYDRWQPCALRVKIRAQMVIGVFIILSLFSLLVLQVIPERWIHQFFVDIFFVEDPKNGLVAKPPLELVGYALVLSAGIELAYMLYTDGPDEALDPLILGLTAAALLAVSQIKMEAASWQTALIILVLSAAVGFLLYIRHAYAPVERAESTLRERVASLERHVDSLKRQLERANGAPQGVPQEDRKSPETVEDEPERAEPRPDAPGAQEGAQRPWWRRVLGG